MSTTVDPSSLADIRAALSAANAEFFRQYPGDSPHRQPVHTVYGGAHLFKAGTAKKMAEVAVRTLKEHAPSPDDLVEALGVGRGIAGMVHARVLAKLEREAVEDFRIDFEDGYGNRPDAEEDAAAIAAAEEVAAGMAAKSLPPFLGIRVKSLSDELFGRSFRTADLFLTRLLDKTHGRLPDNFVITLPKVTTPEQVTAFVRALMLFEEKALLPAGVVRLEPMIEQTQSILNRHGQANLLPLVRAAEGRCRGAHFGTYDYTASCNITAAYQDMAHPACDFAKHMMQVALSGTGLFLSDGATNVMPVGDRATVHRAWKIAYDHIRHSLRQGYYQGWDLHPAQLPVRYAALYAFFLEGFDSAAARLRAFMDKAAQATLLGDVFDDAATGQGLLNYFLRGLSCGAVTPEEAAKTGLTPAEIATRSFLRILNGRRGA